MPLLASGHLQNWLSAISFWGNNVNNDCDLKSCIFAKFATCLVQEDITKKQLLFF